MTCGSVQGFRLTDAVMADNKLPESSTFPKPEFVIELFRQKFCFNPTKLTLLLTIADDENIYFRSSCL